MGGKNHLQTKSDMFCEFEIHKCFGRINRVMKPDWCEIHFNSEEEKEPFVCELNKTGGNSGRRVLKTGGAPVC